MWYTPLVLEIQVFNDYQTARREAFKASQRVKDRIPCVIGKAECCTHDVPMVREDIERAHQAVTDGKLSEEDIQKAKDKVSDTTNLACGFLAEDNSCRLYGETPDQDYRPLECIEFGYGGFPASKRKLLKRVKQSSTGDPLIPVREFAQDQTLGMCNSCHQTAWKNNTSVPLSVLRVANGVTGYVGLNKVTNTTRFISEEL